MNTSQSSHCCAMTRLLLLMNAVELSGGAPFRGLVGMRDQTIAEPAAVLPGLDPGTQALAIARAIALEHGVEFRPVRLAVVVALLVFVPDQVVIRHLQAQILGLRHGFVDELLA